VYLRHRFSQVIRQPHFERRVAAGPWLCQASIRIVSSEHWQGAPTPCGNVCVLRSEGSLFSEKIKPLIEAKEFPLREKAVRALKTLKQDLTSAAFKVIDEKLPFVSETDAPDDAISVTLNQEDRPVAFFSRTLNKCESHQSSVEKEACVIVEAIRKWAHLLSGRRFTVVTDQQSVSFVYDVRHSSKIKKWEALGYATQRIWFSDSVSSREVKFSPWRPFQGILREFVRKYPSYHSCVTVPPGTTRLYHFVRVKNLPYSLVDVRKIVEGCRVCSKVKPNFCKPPSAQFIKATQPFARLSVDFKGPLPSTTKNRYLLTFVDEYSRFPFAFPCASVDAKTFSSFQPAFCVVWCACVHSFR